ncbi:hypothetical protein BASA81_001748 [Batrachochytrium salamandrivorans]|nr:hypothetical protein BASA81_001748 [Batrachochytrium salamandrivorans]
MGDLASQWSEALAALLGRVLGILFPERNHTQPNLGKKQKMGQSQSSDSPLATPSLASSAFAALREDQAMDPRSPLPQGHRMSVAMRKQVQRARDPLHDNNPNSSQI